MGNCSNGDRGGDFPGITPRQYVFKSIIGKGGFGEVWKATHVGDKKTYAIKVMNKVKILSSKSVESVMDERKLLTKLDNQLQFSFFVKGKKKNEKSG